jgi:hypothetical protein
MAKMGLWRPWLLCGFDSTPQLSAAVQDLPTLINKNDPVLQAMDQLLPDDCPTDDTVTLPSSMFSAELLIFRQNIISKGNRAQ